MTDRLIKITTALAVVAVALVAAVISYQHAFELVRSHGESGLTARLQPFTVDGLIWAASMVAHGQGRQIGPHYQAAPQGVDLHVANLEGYSKGSGAAMASLPT